MAVWTNRSAVNAQWIDHNHLNENPIIRMIRFKMGEFYLQLKICIESKAFYFGTSQKVQN